MANNDFGPPSSSSDTPPKIKFEKTPGGFVIIRQWSIQSVNLFFGFLFFLLVAFYFILEWGNSTNSTLICLMSFLFGLAGLLFSGLMSSTKISVNHDQIITTTKRLFFRHQKSAQCVDVKNISINVIKHSEHRGRGIWYTFRVFIVLRNDDKTLLDDCDTEEQALFIKQQLDHTIGLTLKNDVNILNDANPFALKSEETYSEAELALSKSIFDSGFFENEGVVDQHNYSEFLLHIINSGSKNGIDFVVFEFKTPYIKFTMPKKELPDLLIVRLSEFDRPGGIQFDKNSFFNREYKVTSPQEVDTRKVLTPPIRNFIRNQPIYYLKVIGCDVLMDYISTPSEDGSSSGSFELLQMMLEAARAI